MRIEEVIWLRDVVDKLSYKHGVETSEVEEALKFRFVEKGFVTLPPERQAEALDFVLFLKQRQSCTARERKAKSGNSLRSHRAFGSWRGRDVDALVYEQALRSEWHDGA
jgi:hypothetical protein